MKRSPVTIMLTLILWIATPMPPALAHANLVSAIPSINAHLPAIPPQVRLEFKERLLILGNAEPNVLIVRDANGVQIDKSDSKVSGRFLKVSLNTTGASGTFTVTWRVVSVDGHPVEGSYQFSTPTPVVISPALTPDSKPSASANGGNYLAASFWKKYESQFVLGALFLIALLIWARFKYLEKGRRRDIGGL